MIRDFKENMLFQIYKDKPMISNEALNNEIYLKYHFFPSKGFGERIREYQVKKYGCRLNELDSKRAVYQKHFHNNTKKTRDNKRERMKRDYQANKNLERLEELKEKELKRK